MEKVEIIKKLKAEFAILKSTSEKQFEERFSTSKHEDSWNDDLFRAYQESRVRVELLLELLT